MIRVPYYIVDAFTSTLFKGNPAAVCPLQEWLPDATLAAIAEENNLSETAFFTGEKGRYDLRWFTPTYEIELCGHATLASAFVIFTFLEKTLEEVIFKTKSGALTVSRKDSLLALNFPVRKGKAVTPPPNLAEGLGVIPKEFYQARNYLCVVETEAEVKNCNPRFELLEKLPARGIIVTAPGSSSDFVSRVFFPDDSIKEDPVTGSAHCTLIPYWAKRLGKKKLFGRQISARGGELFCEDQGERVQIAGNAVLYAEGILNINH